MSHVVRRLLPVSGRRTGWHVVSLQLLLALIVSLVTAVIVVSYDQMVSRAAMRQMQNTADLAQVFLNQQNAGIAAVISSATKAGDVNAALEDPGSARSKQVIQGTLAIVSASGTDIASVVITDGRGRVISALPQKVASGYDVSQRPWFKEAIKARSFSVSPVFESAVTQGLNLTTISVPVRLNGRPDGTLLGVVSVAQRLDGYQGFVDAYTHNRDIQLSVVDGDGAVVAQGGVKGLPVATPVAARIAIGRRLLTRNDRQIMAVSHDNTAGADPIATGDHWQVISQVSKASALRPAVFFRAVAVTAGSLILIASFLLGFVRRRARRAKRDVSRHLEQSQSRMRELADSSPDVLFRLNPDGTVIFSSRASSSVLDRSPEELVGTDLTALLACELAPDAQSRLGQLIEDGEPQVFAARIAEMNGTPRIVECMMRLGLTEDVTEVWGALRDITDRRTARDQVEQLFQLSEDFMAVVDFDGLLVQTNPVWTAAFGLASENLIGRRFESMFRPGDQERLNAALSGLAQEPAVATFETLYLPARGSDEAVRTLLWTAAADPGRRLIYAVGRDITDHKALQRALAQTRDEALEASRLKSEFVATMSHEIRTPMNGVIGLTDLLLGTGLDDTQRRYVEGVRTAGDALLSVINDILDFSKIEAGRMVLDNVDFRLEDVVDDVVTLIRQAAIAKGLELSVEYLPGVPFALNGDPGRLRQILLNLAHNAVKFTSVGGVSVRVEPGQGQPDGDVEVVFKVIDTGIGIEPARLEELFEPFRQADEGVSRAYGGTGLGLSICRRLADLMGGTIHAVSEIGRGTTFVAELIFTPAADGSPSVRGRDARGLAVLVVDDNEVNRLVMVTQMSRWGMRPVAAASAQEAMELLSRSSLSAGGPAGGYDLAVVDMHMPQTSGLALVRQLRAVPALEKLPVIMLTSDETVDRQTAFDHGISARLTKPVQQSALFDALTRVGLSNGAKEPNQQQDQERDQDQDRKQDQKQSRNRGDEQGRPGKGLHLLLVEDNDINQTVALGILSQLGYQVDVAQDGVEAIAMAGRRSYDAILMDCQMPRLDGYAATIELRSRPATRRTPIIAMTAATFAADRQRCFDSGMDDFLAKPVRVATLQATLNRWLQPGLDEAQLTAIPAQSRAESDSPSVDRLPGVDRLRGVDQPRGVEQPGTADIPRRQADDEEDPLIAGTEERIAELLGGGSQLEVDKLRDMIGKFLDRTVDLAQRLALAVAAQDAEAVRLHAHSLAGAALNLGTVRVVRISRQIEADAKAGHPGFSVTRLVELEIALDAARMKLRNLAAGLPEADAGAEFLIADRASRG